MLAVTQDRIESEYSRLGFQAGWRFMTCPERQFDSPEVLLILLNPSGRVEHGPRWSQEAGNAYVVESWEGQAPGTDALQIQIQRLVQHLGVSFEKVASAQFVPFRSQRWADLPRANEAVKFANGIWTEFVEGLTPNYVVCVGAQLGSFIPQLFGARNMRQKKTGWGEISLSVGQTSYGGQIAVLPHLGTFKLFSRAECAPFLKSAIGPESLSHA